MELDLELRGFAPPLVPPVYYAHSLLGFTSVQWEPPQISHCRGVLHALRKRVARFTATNDAEAIRSRHCSSTSHGVSRRSSVARRNGQQSGADESEAVLKHLRMIDARGAGAEYAYVTALSGRKQLRLSTDEPHTASQRRPQ